MSKIIGVTVGTPLSPESIKRKIQYDAEAIAQMQSDIAKIQSDLNYVPIDITSIKNNVGSTVEMGRTINDVTVTWAVNKQPVSQTVDGAAVDASTRSKAFTGLGLTSKKTFTVSATDERGASDSASTTINFYNGVYYGVIASGATIDNATVQGLTNNLQSGKSITFKATATASQKIIFALPARYGTPKFTVGGFEGGFSLVQTFDYTNASGYKESYCVWLSDEPGPYNNLSVGVS